MEFCFAIAEGKNNHHDFSVFFPFQGEHELDHGSWHQPRQEEAKDWNLVAYGCIFRETKAIECKGTRLAYKMVPTLWKMEFEWFWGGSYQNFILKFHFCIFAIMFSQWTIFINIPHHSMSLSDGSSTCQTIKCNAWVTAHWCTLEFRMLYFIRLKTIQNNRDPEIGCAG